MKNDSESNGTKLKINEVVRVGKDDDANVVSSGVYLYRLKTDKGVLMSQKYYY